MPIYPLAPVIKTFVIGRIIAQDAYALPECHLLNYGSGVNKTVDADFLALPLTAVSDAAISTAKDAGASHIDVRIERTRNGFPSLRYART